MTILYYYFGFENTINFASSECLDDVTTTINWPAHLQGGILEFGKRRAQTCPWCSLWKLKWEESPNLSFLNQSKWEESPNLSLFKSGTGSQSERKAQTSHFSSLELEAKVEKTPNLTSWSEAYLALVSGSKDDGSQVPRVFSGTSRAVGCEVWFGRGSWRTNVRMDLQWWQVGVPCEVGPYLLPLSWPPPCLRVADLGVQALAWTPGPGIRWFLGRVWGVVYPHGGYLAAVFPGSRIPCLAVSGRVLGCTFLRGSLGWLYGTSSVLGSLHVFSDNGKLWVLYVLRGC